jgi:hypothetical protein
MIARSAGHREFPFTRRLWSLRDMLRIYADEYIGMGAKIADARAAFNRMTFGVTIDGEYTAPILQH